MVLEISGPNKVNRNDLKLSDKCRIFKTKEAVGKLMDDFTPIAELGKSLARTKNNCFEKKTR